MSFGSKPQGFWILNGFDGGKYHGHHPTVLSSVRQMVLGCENQRPRHFLEEFGGSGWFV